MLQAADGQFAPTEAAPLDSLLGVPTPEQAGTIATFLYARLHHFAAACQAMGSVAELTAFVNDVRRVLSSAAQTLGGDIAQRRPESILCVFTHNPEERVPTHAKRGLHAAILTVHEAMQLAARVGPQLEAAGVPPLSLAVGVHLGVGEVAPRVTSSNEKLVHATGEAVEIARLLEVAATDLHWSVAASAPTRQAAGSRMESGARGTLGLLDDTFVDIVQVTGLTPREGSATPARHYEALRESVRRNQQRARSGSRGLQALHGGPQRGGSHLLIEDYRILKKIGAGAVASVFLAQPHAGGPVQVLKVLRLDCEEGVQQLQRFLQEYALLSRIDHPNVTRIHRQGFSAGSAYIAMEYFPAGDLRSRLRRPLDRGIALYYLKQIASGLDAIHRAGIVHRDLKPDNVMVRQDGIVAIADFGVAKLVATKLTDTGAGDVVGTPYYLSPEQAMGRTVDARSDLYSLGVMAYEMLTGAKPYTAASAQELLALHVRAPLPRLPAAHADLQSALDKLMAKDPAGRYASAAALLDDLERLGR